MTAPTVALVLETNNLRAESFTRQSALDTLQALLEAMAPQAGGLESLVIPHDGLTLREQAALSGAFGGRIEFMEIDSNVDYYDAKNRGFFATRADIVVFADGDCTPDPNWLASLLAPFSDPLVAVVAGRTTYGQGVFAEAMTAVDFLFFPSPLGPDWTRNFYANNVAFRREVFARHFFPSAAELHHGQCALLALALAAEGTRIRFAPEARTTHRLTPDKREWIALRLARGADADELAPRLLGAAFNAPEIAVRLGSWGTALVLGARLVHSLRAAGARGAPRRVCARSAAIVAISALDFTGALSHASKRLLAGTFASSLSPS